MSVGHEWAAEAPDRREAPGGRDERLVDRAVTQMWVADEAARRAPHALERPASGHPPPRVARAVAPALSQRDGHIARGVNYIYPDVVVLWELLALETLEQLDGLSGRFPKSAGS